MVRGGSVDYQTFWSKLTDKVARTNETARVHRDSKRGRERGFIVWRRADKLPPRAANHPPPALYLEEHRRKQRGPQRLQRVDQISLPEKATGIINRGEIMMITMIMMMKMILLMRMIIMIVMTMMIMILMTTTMM